MSSPTPGATPAFHSKRVRTLIVYQDLALARQTMERLARNLRDSDPNVVLHPMLWRLDQLNDPRWRECSLRDAGQADVIVFAMRPSLAFSQEANRWLEPVLSLRQGLPTEVLALPPGEDPWLITLEHATEPAFGNTVRIGDFELTPGFVEAETLLAKSA